VDGHIVDHLYRAPPHVLWEIAETLQTPAVIYDISALRHVVREMQGDISVIPGARLNFALKACHTPAILKLLAGFGLGCDVASTGEFLLACQAGFAEISATGPAFSIEDFHAFRSAGVVVDIDSLSQLQVFGERFPSSEVGVRLRIPLAAAVTSDATFGSESRFGMKITDRRLFRIISEHDLKITRMHVHTGQTTPEAALFKIDYLLAAAEILPDVNLINLGGGLFHFYVDRSAARAVLCKIAARLERFRHDTSREIALRFEPGGALMAPCGYLVTEVRAVEEQSALGQRVVTVDASAWNVAPWHKPQVFILPDRGGEVLPGLLAGNTLYEHDFFGRDIFGRQMPLAFPACRVGDRALITAFGAYTMTNGRRFNRIPMPREFMLEDERLSELTHVDSSPGQ
jgi:diaminopimelate decarboxylase